MHVMRTQCTIIAVVQSGILAPAGVATLVLMTGTPQASLTSTFFLPLAVAWLKGMMYP